MTQFCLLHVYLETPTDLNVQLLHINSLIAWLLNRKHLGGKLLKTENIRGGIEMESLSKHNNPSVLQTEKHMIEQAFWFGVKESKSRCKVVTTRAG